MKTRGPAELLDSLTSMDRPRTNDYKDSTGRIYKVEVIVPAGFNRENVATYYHDRLVCEKEQINANKNLADKYR